MVSDIAEGRAQGPAVAAPGGGRKPKQFDARADVPRVIEDCLVASGGCTVAFVYHDVAQVWHRLAPVFPGESLDTAEDDITVPAILLCLHNRSAQPRDAANGGTVLFDEFIGVLKHQNLGISVPFGLFADEEPSNRGLASSGWKHEHGIAMLGCAVMGGVDGCPLIVTRDHGSLPQRAQNGAAPDAGAEAPVCSTTAPELAGGEDAAVGGIGAEPITVRYCP